jgi:hypothetical protein
VDIETFLAAVESKGFPAPKKLGNANAWPVQELRRWITECWPTDGLIVECERARHQANLDAFAQFAAPEWKRQLVAWLERQLVNPNRGAGIVWGRNLKEICGLDLVAVKELVKFGLLPTPGWNRSALCWCWAPAELLKFLKAATAKAMAA